MVFNDLPARGLQRSASQWTTGKALDGFAPCGPCMILAGDVADVTALELTTKVNGDVRHAARVSEMIFSIPELVAFLTRTMTLVPGDIIATGTPAGVGTGCDPQAFLRPGDVVEVAISGIGEICNGLGPMV